MAPGKKILLEVEADAGCILETGEPYIKVTVSGLS